MNDETVPSHWSRGFIHSADLECWSCLGAGEIDGYECGVCNYKGTYHVGCGGPAEMDEAHPAIGGNCFQCGMVAVEELVKAA